MKVTDENVTCTVKQYRHFIAKQFSFELPRTLVFKSRTPEI